MNSTQITALTGALKVAVDAVLLLDEKSDKPKELLALTQDTTISHAQFAEQIKRLAREKKEFLMRIRELYHGEVPREVYLVVLQDDFGNRGVEAVEVQYARTPLNLNNFGPVVEQSEIQDVMKEYIDQRIDIWEEYKNAMKGSVSKEKSVETLKRMRDDLLSAKEEIGRLQVKLSEAKIALIEMRILKSHGPKIDFLDKFRESLSEVNYKLSDQKCVIEQLKQENARLKQAGCFTPLYKLGSTLKNLIWSSSSAEKANNKTPKLN